jgi:Kef-type K+ transport system membrane component KefB
MNIGTLASELVIDIGIILFAVRLGRMLAAKIHIPSVLGELIMGVVLGPYALGGIPFPGFPDGLFALGGGAATGSPDVVKAVGESIAVNPLLYGFSEFGSILLLFFSGLETDVRMFMRYALAGIALGLGGVIVSFFFGAATGMLFFHLPLLNPQILFLGALATATSVGITARLLSELQKTDTPEGVTIMAAAVFDDVLGVIVLAVVIGIVRIIQTGGNGGGLGGQILLISAKALGIWAGFTIVGLLAAHKIAAFLKLFKNPYDTSILAFALALIVAGIFEKAGLALIIGAYVMGISLSASDIAHIIRERLHSIYEFFVPIFFAVTGMLIDVRSIFNPVVLGLGLLYTLTAILGKVIGCGLPALFLGFNAKGALRVGVGMIPRGAVALIVASIGMQSGVLNRDIFDVVIMMIFITTIGIPPFVSAALNMEGKGTRKEDPGIAALSFKLDCQSVEIACTLMERLITNFKDDGFLVDTVNLFQGSYGLFEARRHAESYSVERRGQLLLVEGEEKYLPRIRAKIQVCLESLQEIGEEDFEMIHEIDEKPLESEVSKA